MWRSTRREGPGGATPARARATPMSASRSGTWRRRSWQRPQWSLRSPRREVVASLPAPRYARLVGKRSGTEAMHMLRSESRSARQRPLTHSEPIPDRTRVRTQSRSRHSPCILPTATGRSKRARIARHSCAASCLKLRARAAAVVCFASVPRGRCDLEKIYAAAMEPQPMETRGAHVLTPRRPEICPPRSSAQSQAGT